MRKIFLAGAVALLLSACSSTIYIVRHAEKRLDGSADPDLTFEGRERANALRDTLTGKILEGVYATPYKRTEQTASPTALISVTPVRFYNAAKGGELLDSLVRKKKAEYLVVGHSNTIVPMLEHIGLHPSMKEIPESKYDLLFVVKLHWGLGRKIELVEKTYGKPTP